ncbi:hypothetical protein [Pedobacter mendelii]|uniref:General stress protein n=1 Tax=Pedobacter mendelii TaxID=1908240 RepID=A0ABQ2BJ06_9SPHI|nr:hypothetical protein [Pedobacter mendelii]GGI25590.1 hypothetical protein GCM10008119_18420 [Pedobacter mendelii]
MKNDNHKEPKNKDQSTRKTSGNSKEKVSFDQNGKGASEKYGEAGSTPNEAGDENGLGTTNEHKK